MLSAFDAPLRLVLMGVAGSGKSSVGAALEPLLTARYLDGDDLHPAENIAKMRAGVALQDADRLPWLAEIGRRLRPEARLIVGCSALKRSYRDLIRAEAQAEVGFVHLAGSRAVIAARMRARAGHFMPDTLLDSQFAALQPPQADEVSLTVDIDQSLAVIARQIADWAGSLGQTQG